MYTLEFVVIMCSCYAGIRLNAILNSHGSEICCLGNKVNVSEHYVVESFYSPSRAITLMQQAGATLNLKVFFLIHPVYMPFIS